MHQVAAAQQRSADGAVGLSDPLLPPTPDEVCSGNNSCKALARFATWRVIGDVSVYAAKDGKSKTMRELKQGDRVQCAKAGDEWLQLEGGGGFAQSKDERGDACMLEQLALRAWEDVQTFACNVDAEHIKRELFGSCAQACHFEIGDVSFVDAKEVLAVRDAAGYKDGRTDRGDVLGVEDGKILVLPVDADYLVEAFPYQLDLQDHLWERKQDEELLQTVRSQIQWFGYVGFGVTPIFLIIGWGWHGRFVGVGRLLLYVLYVVVFAFTANLALKFRDRDVSTRESVMFQRLLRKTQRLPYFNTSLFVPASCVIFFFAIPSYTDHLTLSLAIGDTARKWERNSTRFEEDWTGSWSGIPVLCHVAPLVTLPQVLLILMIIDQCVALFTFSREAQAHSYLGLQPAASVASLLFISELLAGATAATKSKAMTWPKIQAFTMRFVVKVMCGIQLRLWFKVSLFVLMRRANGPWNDGEVTLLIAICTSFLHAATGTMDLATFLFTSLTRGRVEYVTQYGVFPWGPRPAVLAFLFALALFPVFGSAVRLVGAFLCPAPYDFEFSSFGCAGA